MAVGRRTTAFAFVALVPLLVSTGCGTPRPRATPLTPPPPLRAYTTPPARSGPAVTVVATARVPEVAVFDRAGSPRPRLTLANPQPSGAPLVFVVRGSTRERLHVLLPVRPNGSSGWIARGDVALSEHDFRIVVELAAHRITVYRGDAVIDREAIGVGRAQTPTPGGTYYTKALLRPPNPNGFYGPYAYELSGFSDVLHNFDGGGGVIGIHGTNEPWLLGHDVSHGCIRMSNAGITRLARILPLGVPVEIHA